MPLGANSLKVIVKTVPVLPETGFIRLPQVLQLIPVSRSSWWAGCASGRYPKGYKLSERVTGWKCEHIRQLIERLGAQGAA